MSKSGSDNNVILAAKCSLDESIFSQIHRAGLEAVELYLSEPLLNDTTRLIQLCQRFPLRYAVHAPNDGSAINELAELTKEISAEVVVFHNIYWEDEWSDIVELFKEIPARLCVENVYTVHDQVKLVKRYGMSRCLDLEHLQMECNGVYEEGFLSVMREATHIHLTGYRYGSSLWHTPIHHSPRHSRYMLGLLRKANYSGFIVSEARTSFQTYSEFKKLRNFYENWQKNYPIAQRENS